MRKSKHLSNNFFHFSSTYSRFHVYFKEESVVPLVRYESHDLIYFLANSGGLFVLFMGASLLSFIELIYYLIFRVFVIAVGGNGTH